jgi:hypothetical protein
MRPFRNFPVLLAVGGVAIVSLLGGWSAVAPSARSAAAPPVLMSSTSPAAADTPSPPPPPKSIPADGHELGGVDLNGYCRYVGYDGAKLLVNNPYGWVCYSNTGEELAAITVNDACQWQYSWDDVGVPPGNNDPNAWRCWSVN